MRDRLRHRPVLLPSRRQFLVGAAAMAAFGACSDDGGSGEASGSNGDVETGDQVLSVSRIYGGYFVAGRANRVPFGLSDEDGPLPVEAVPSELTITVTGPDGSTVAEGITAPVRAEGLTRPYYAFEFTPEAAGFYDYSMQTDAGEVISQVQVVEADDPVIEALVGPDDELPALETPTVDDSRGVTPICTMDPPCDLHGETVAEVLGTAPMVLVVATPAFCQTALCGPVLEVVIDQMPDFPGVRFVHAEVFSDPENNSSPITREDYAPVIDALGLPFEPVMYAVGADGIVRERLDYIFDGSEVNEVIQRLVG